MSESPPKPSRQRESSVTADFRTWLRAAFDHPVIQPAWYWAADFDDNWQALGLSDEVVVVYLTKLFRDPSPLKAFSLSQVAQGIWFLVGEASQHSLATRCSSRRCLLRSVSLVSRPLPTSFDTLWLRRRPGRQQWTRKLFIQPATCGGISSRAGATLGLVSLQFTLRALTPWLKF